MYNEVLLPTEVMVLPNDGAQEAYMGNAAPRQTVEQIDDQWGQELTDLVSANADVMIICPWQCGHEVTLGDAMTTFDYPPNLTAADEPYLLSIVYSLLNSRADESNSIAENFPVAEAIMQDIVVETIVQNEPVKLEASIKFKSQEEPTTPVEVFAKLDESANSEAPINVVSPVTVSERLLTPNKVKKTDLPIKNIVAPQIEPVKQLESTIRSAIETPQAIHILAIHSSKTTAALKDSQNMAIESSTPTVVPPLEKSDTSTFRSVIKLIELPEGFVVKNESLQDEISQPTAVEANVTVPNKIAEVVAFALPSAAETFVTLPESEQVIMQKIQTEPHADVAPYSSENTSDSIAPPQGKTQSTPSQSENDNTPMPAADRKPIANEEVELVAKDHEERSPEPQDDASIVTEDAYSQQSIVDVTTTQSENKTGVVGRPFLDEEPNNQTDTQTELEHEYEKGTTEQTSELDDGFTDNVTHDEVSTRPDRDEACVEELEGTLLQNTQTAIRKLLVDLGHSSQNRVPVIGRVAVELYTVRIGTMSFSTL